MGTDEKGSNLLSMGHPLDRTALPLFVPVGWKRVPSAGNWRDRIALGIWRDEGGRGGDDRERQQEKGWEITIGWEGGGREESQT